MQGTDSFQDDLGDVGFEAVAFGWEGIAAGVGWLGACGVGKGWEDNVIRGASARETESRVGEGKGESEVGGGEMHREMYRGKMVNEQVYTLNVDFFKSRKSNRRDFCTDKGFTSRAKPIRERLKKIRSRLVF